MFGKEDNTYQEILEKSVERWLTDIENHDDIVVRGGIKAVREYIASLKKQNKMLEEKNQLKDFYLKKRSKNEDKKNN